MSPSFLDGGAADSAVNHNILLDRPHRNDIYDDKNQVVTSATYDKYQEFNGIQFPMEINIRRPIDEYTLKLEVTKLTLNQPLENDQFELKIPSTAVVQKMN